MCNSVFCLNTNVKSKKKIPAGIYLLKVNNRNTRAKYEICSKLTPCSSVSFVNSEHVIAG